MQPFAPMQPFTPDVPDHANASPLSDELIVDLEGYEGPIAVLLTLARDQKVDLAHLSIAALADQYMAFINTAHRLRLELAADYLVMAAWLAYLKSRLLLPDPPPDDEPSGPELAAELTFRLQRLEAMRRAGSELLAGSLLGRDSFGRGAPEAFTVTTRPVYALSLYDLLKAYGAHQARQTGTVLQIRPPEYFSIDDALRRLSGLIGGATDWRRLASFLPPHLRGGTIERSAIAATFAASLELVKAGRIELRQDGAFEPLYLRAARPTA
ncbi:MAG TPA: ScpA family protein [Stellaceae bacterium]|nr:ScpA family protein [Stellaceae bacterium]